MLGSETEPQDLVEATIGWTIEATVSYKLSKTISLHLEDVNVVGDTFTKTSITRGVARPLLDIGKRAFTNLYRYMRYYYTCRDELYWERQSKYDFYSSQEGVDQWD